VTIQVLHTAEKRCQRYVISPVVQSLGSMTSERQVTPGAVACETRFRALAPVACETRFRALPPND
jgi:hypothetical protein